MRFFFETTFKLSLKSGSGFDSMEHMKIKFLAVLFLSIFLVSCNEDLITETEFGPNSITLSGVVSKSFEATTYAGSIDDYSGLSFNLSMHPKGCDSFEEQFSLRKFSTSLPEIGLYNIDDGLSLGGNEFKASYMFNDSISFLNDSLYVMVSGTVKITESSVLKYEGHFNLSGYKLEFPIDSANVLNIVGEFSVVPENF